MIGPVAAVVPTFRPDQDVVARLVALRRQVDLLVVCDDGSGAAFAPVLDDLETAGCIVVRNQENAGIARALNRAAAAAMASGAEWLLTVDQDSRVHEHYVVAAAALLARLQDPQGRGIAVVAGGFDGQVDPQRDPFRWPNGTWELLQSGLLVSSDVFRRVGPFDEGLFIDCVDTEWGLRAQAMGIRFAIAAGCVLDHGAGIVVRRRLGLLGEIEFSVHSPLRRYYITRNRVLLASRYAIRRPRWFAVQARAQAQIALLGILQGPARRRQALGLVLGLASAVSGGRGPAPDAISSRLRS